MGVSRGVATLFIEGPGCLGVRAKSGCRGASQGRASARTQAWSSREGVDEWDPCDSERGRGGTELGREKGAGPELLLPPRR